MLGVTEHAHHDSHSDLDLLRLINRKMDAMLCLGERIMSAQDQTNAYLDAQAPILAEIGTDLDTLIAAAPTDLDPATTQRIKDNLAQLSALAAKFTPPGQTARAVKK